MKLRMNPSMMSKFGLDAFNYICDLLKLFSIELYHNLFVSSITHVYLSSHLKVVIAIHHTLCMSPMKKSTKSWYSLSQYTLLELLPSS